MISHGYEIYGVFRNPEAVPALVDELEKWMRTLPEGQKPRCLWLQEGVGNPDAEEKARKLGLQVVSNLCILKEHARLL